MMMERVEGRGGVSMKWGFEDVIEGVLWDERLFEMVLVTHWLEE